MAAAARFKRETFGQSHPVPSVKNPSVLEGMDWTRYEGVLHTDHAVRAEFFLDREVAPMKTRPYLMDFTYLKKPCASLNSLSRAEIGLRRCYAEDETP